MGGYALKKKGNPTTAKGSIQSYDRYHLAIFL